MVLVGDRTPPLSCLRAPTVEKRTQYRQMYLYFRLLTLSNLFRVNRRRVDGERVTMHSTAELIAPRRVSFYSNI